MLARVGLLLDLIGALMLGLDILGADRLKRAEEQVRGALQCLARPRRFYLLLMYGKEMPRGLRRLNYALGLLALPLTILVAIKLVRWIRLALAAFDFPMYFFLVVWVSFMGWFFVYPALVLFVAVILWIGLVPIRFGYYLQERLGLSGALPAGGILLLVMGFILQLIGTWTS